MSRLIKILCPIGGVLGLLVGVVLAYLRWNLFGFWDAAAMVVLGTLFGFTGTVIILALLEGVLELFDPEERWPHV